jgi:3-phosphoshikimate 1-carboxyvinyltransferase
MVPLERMGARLAAADGRPPLTIEGTTRLKAIDFEPDVPSAQVKSAVLLAGLHSEGMTRVRESTATRDHTERALATFGVEARQDAQGICIRGGQRLTA